MILPHESVIYSVKSTAPLQSMIINLYDAKKDEGQINISLCNYTASVIAVSVLNIHYYVLLDYLLFCMNLPMKT